MKNRFIMICFLIICVSYGYLCMKPIVISDKQNSENEFLSDSLYNPIASYDFTCGNNQIILYINCEEVRFLPKKMKHWTLLTCKDNSTIEQIKKHFEFIRVSKDHCETTASDSKVIFFKDNTKIFESQILIEGNSVALYFKNAGWTFSANDSELISLFFTFTPIYTPIIVQ